MKKLSIIILVLILSANYAFCQGLVILDEHGNDITFGYLVVRDSPEQPIIYANIFFKNETDGNIQVLVRRIQLDILEGTFNSFCWGGVCYSQFVDEADSPIVLEAGQTSSGTCFYGDYRPQGKSGFSIIEYEFFSAGTCFETVKTTVVYATNGVPYLVFHPGDEAENVAFDAELLIHSDISLSHEDGTTITSESLQDVINFRIGNASGPDVAFNASINDEHTKITVTPASNLIHETSYFLEVLPLMGAEGEISEPQSISFTTQEETETSLAQISTSKGTLSDPFPNPAIQHTSIYYDLPADTQQASINIYAVSGAAMVKSFQLNVDDNQTRVNTSGWKSGIYIYRLIADEVPVASKKLIISK